MDGGEAILHLAIGNVFGGERRQPVLLVHIVQGLAPFVIGRNRAAEFAEHPLQYRLDRLHLADRAVAGKRLVDAGDDVEAGMADQPLFVGHGLPGGPVERLALLLGRLPSASLPTMAASFTWARCGNSEKWYSKPPPRRSSLRQRSPLRQS